MSVNTLQIDTEPSSLPQDNADSQQEEISTRPKRTIKPSLKLLEQYEANKAEMSENLSDMWNKTVQCINAADDTCDIEQLSDMLAKLKRVYESYKRLSEKYFTLLSSINTEESMQELDHLTTLNKERHNTFQEARARIDDKILQQHETASIRTTSSRHTKRSSRSSHSRYSTLSDCLIKARAEAEAAKAEASCIQRAAAIKVQVAETQAMQAKAQAEAQAKQAKAQAEAQAKQARAQAEAQAAQAEAQATQAKAQAETQVKQAKLEADLEVLDKEREKAVAVAKLKVYEQAVAESELDNVSLANTENRMERTKDYVLSQSSGSSLNAVAPDYTDIPSKCQPPAITNVCDVPVNLSTYQAESLRYSRPSERKTTQRQITNSDVIAQAKPAPLLQVSDLPSTTYVPQRTQPAIATNYKPVSGLNASATPYYPKPHNSDMSDFARYMVRRQLTSTGLTKFDDRPENYRGWKSTFKAAISDLDIPPGEEFDMLIKWLGSQSLERVIRLKAVYADNPAAGLHAAWERLEQSYGSPEAIEDALFKRLHDFPKISGRDNQKLQELSDLLLELQLAKTDPHLPGLSYLDTSRGVNPIVAKLPFNIQEKWIVTGSRYKDLNHVSFPPFSYFCDFIRNIATIRNDPSFMFGEPNTQAPTFPKDRHVQNKSRDYRIPVSVKKTYALPNSDSSSKGSNVQFQSDTSSGKSDQMEAIEDPNRLCPIHKKIHPLKKCIGFRKKPLQERMQLLKQFGICFKCCASTEHLAKNCNAIISCMECGSDTHVQALHPLEHESPPADPLPAASDHGGESHEQSPATITSKCSKIHYKDLWGKTPAKICLVKVFRARQPEKAVKMYAVLDDQSSHSLATSEFFDLFGIEGNVLPYTLHTCSGAVQLTGRMTCSEFVISPIQGTERIDLPCIIECNQLPNDREEIPTPEDALSEPHLRHLANCIPPLDNDAKIMLLLGRDILRVHKVRELYNGWNNDAYAQKTDLGWVIIGVNRGFRPRISDDVHTNKIIIQQGHGITKELSCHTPSKTTFQTTNNNKLESSTGDQKPNDTVILHSNSDVLQLMDCVTSYSKPILTSVDAPELPTKDQLQHQASSAISITTSDNCKLTTSLHMENSSENSKDSDSTSLHQSADLTFTAQADTDVSSTVLPKGLLRPKGLRGSSKSSTPVIEQDHPFLHKLQARSSKPFKKFLQPTGEIVLLPPMGNLMGTATLGQVT